MALVPASHQSRVGCALRTDIITTIKTTDEFRNLSVTAAAALSRVAYAMSHLSAVNLATGWLGVSTHELLLRPSSNLRSGGVVPV